MSWTRGLTAKLAVLSALSVFFVIFQAPAASAAHGAPTVTGYIALQNAATKKCINVPGQDDTKPGGWVKQYTCNDTALENMRWSLERLPGLHKGYGRFLIHHELAHDKRQMCLDLPNFGKVKKGTKVETYYCAAQNDNQVFWAKKVKGGWRFVHEKTGLCLDVAGQRSKKNDRDITLWKCSSKNDHAWILRVPHQRVVPNWVSLGCGINSNSQAVTWGPGTGMPEVRVKLNSRLPIPVDIGFGTNSDDSNVVWALSTNWSSQQVGTQFTGASRGQKILYWWSISGSFVIPGDICAEGKGWKAE